MTTSTDATETFEQHRSTLIGAAYRILGSRSDAEDVVQEAWIRWSGVDHDTIDEPRAFLLTVTTRLALNRLRQLATRKESYVGPWLPEPVATDPRGDGEAAAQLADEVSMAMLIVLESLSPLERAAFVLTEVFGMSAPEVGAALDRSPAAGASSCTAVARTSRRASRDRSFSRSGTGDHRALHRRPAAATSLRCSRCSPPTSSWPPTAVASGRPRSARPRSRHVRAGPGPGSRRASRSSLRAAHRQRRAGDRGEQPGRCRRRHLRDGRGRPDNRPARHPEPRELGAV